MVNLAFIWKIHNECLEKMRRKRLVEMIARIVACMVLPAAVAVSLLLGILVWLLRGRHGDVSR